MTKLRIRTKRPIIAYPGSTIQQSYAEDVTHGYLRWDIEDRDRFDVRFCGLPNPCPYVTINWLGMVELTLADAQANHVSGSRFRVYSRDPLSQKDVVGLTSALRNEMQATEVTFKTDQHVERNIISTGTVSLAKDDLGNPDVVLRLLKEYHAGADVTDDEWHAVNELVKGYLTQVDAGDSVRNSKWSLRRMKFDNTFGYGDGNSINFDNLSGIVGIFGPNRSGKSSIVGTIMYGLFNGTDRGSIKNLHVINARKSHCFAQTVITVNGTDYVFERQTVKNETKKGQFFASTSLNVFQVQDGEAIDLGGEQRNDTEKVIRNLIGSPEDFLLTSLSAQDDIKLFISQGASRRRQILTRFLDLDIFDRLYDLAKGDVSAAKMVLKGIPDRDWSVVTGQLEDQIAECDDGINERIVRLTDTQERLDANRADLAAHRDFTPVTPVRVETQRASVRALEKQFESALQSTLSLGSQVDGFTERLGEIDAALLQHDIPGLKRQLEAIRTLGTSVSTLKHLHEKEATGLKAQERSLKILDEVPCGDEYPMCKFIKDAHVNKGKVDQQRERVTRALERLTQAANSLKEMGETDTKGTLDGLELLVDEATGIRVSLANKQLGFEKAKADACSLSAAAEPARARLVELEEALKNDENAEVVMLRTGIDLLQAEIHRIDGEKLNLATERGRVQTLIDRNEEERLKRQELLQQMKAHELVTQACSRHGIPAAVTASQLPIINAEIAKILHGIVDYVVEFEADDESDAVEIYINYGDSRRIIELGSGMEKMIASVAIRVALINVSSLPKTDMLIIDESFGALDDAGVEACNRLLVALKRYFRLVIVITHVEGVKDAADVIIEISKSEKDAKVVYA